MIAVDTHNTARRTVEPSSANMREMSWDDQLADLALDYSQQCEFEHNPVSLIFFGGKILSFNAALLCVYFKK